MAIVSAIAVAWSRCVRARRTVPAENWLL